MTVFDIANSISIIDIYNEFFGAGLPKELEGTRSWKCLCPFAREHADGGIDKNHRIYPATNTAYCFEMHGFLSPVSLISHSRHVPPRRAAAFLVEHYDMTVARDYRSRFAELLTERAVRPVLSGQAVAQAFQLHINATYPPDLQLRPTFQHHVSDLLDMLDRVVRNAPDEDNIKAWLEHAKATIHDAYGRAAAR